MVTPENPNLRGILLMIAAMTGFAIEDMFIKWAAADLPTGQILLMLGVLGTPVFAALARAEGGRLISRDAFHPAILWRKFWAPMQPRRKLTPCGGNWVWISR